MKNILQNLVSSEYAIVEIAPISKTERIVKKGFAWQGDAVAEAKRMRVSCGYTYAVRKIA